VDVKILKKANPSCHVCKSKEVIPIVYGLPSPRLIKDAKKGKFFLGGCVVTGNDPNWYCTNCGTKWRDERSVEKKVSTTGYSSECAYCSKKEPYPFQCNFCDAYFCPAHYLPENHKCSGIVPKDWALIKTKITNIIIIAMRDLPPQKIRKTAEGLSNKAVKILAQEYANFKKVLTPTAVQDVVNKVLTEYRELHKPLLPRPTLPSHLTKKKVVIALIALAIFSIIVILVLFRLG
jgi:hypothetical protein